MKLLNVDLQKADKKAITRYNRKYKRNGRTCSW